MIRLDTSGTSEFARQGVSPRQVGPYVAGMQLITSPARQLALTHGPGMHLFVLGALAVIGAGYGIFVLVRGPRRIARFDDPPTPEGERAGDEADSAAQQEGER
jgi:hypothetical protein